MTSESSSTGETIIREPDHRASALAKALGGRRIRRGGVRYFLAPEKGRQFDALYSAGFWPVRRRGAIMFSRDPQPRALYDALREARGDPQKPLDSGE